MNKSIYAFIIISFFFSSCFNTMLKKGAGYSGMILVSEEKFEPQEISKLKKSTTIFFLKKNDGNAAEEFEAAINRVWTLTDIKIVDIKDAEYYLKRKNYSYIGITAFDYSSDSYGSKKSYFLDFSLPNQKTKKGHEYTLHFARRELVPLKHIPNDEIYVNGDYMNWNPGMLSLYLTQMQEEVALSKRVFALENKSETKSLMKLKKETLYIPKYLFEIPKRGKIKKNKP